MVTDFCWPTDCEFSGLQDALLSDAVAYINGQEMVGELVELLYTLDVSTHDGFLLLEDSDIAIDLDICKLLVLKVPQGSWNLVLSLMVEENVECARVIVDLKLSPHGLLYSSQNPAAEDDVVDGVTVILAHIIGSWLSIRDHFHCDGCEDLGLSPLLSRLEAHVLLHPLVIDLRSGHTSSKPSILLLLHPTCSSI